MDKCLKRLKLDYVDIVMAHRMFSDFDRLNLLIDPR